MIGASTAPIDDIEAIRDSIQGVIAAFNARDANGVIMHYVAEADVVTTSGETLRGREELCSRLSGVFSNPGFQLQQRLVDLTIRFVRDDVALAHVEIEMSGALSASGMPLPPHRELRMRVYVRDEGVWMVSAFHNTAISTE